ncbi:MAG: NADH-quinone oxidoreductase subunit D [Deltaproteobacteria bacterium]|nr:NADH-quinone oxidoreductase subunit D [Deltaproteobacteria bacterium]
MPQHHEEEKHWEKDEGDDFIAPQHEPDLAGDLHTKHMHISLGPSHPATHGTVQIKVELDGETIVKSDTTVGYLHRGFEKSCEQVTWTQCFPYTDRLNYVSPLMNNVGYALAVEKLLGIHTKLPERAQYLRVIASEVSRITDHLTSSAAQAMELGGLTAFFYCVEARERLWDRIEELCGARMTTSWCRVGGAAQDAPEGWTERVLETLDWGMAKVDDLEKLVRRNRIFVDRMVGVGVMSAEDAVNCGWTGPSLRGSGVPYDVRKAMPYLGYDRFKFDIPVGVKGDCYDRFICRLEEMRESRKIVQQAVAQLPKGPVLVDDPNIALPGKNNVYYSIEGLISHFKIIMEGIHVPAGEGYSYTEAANGELGFYLVSDGGGRGWKVRCRPPCFILTSTLDQLIKGQMLPDIVPIFDSINMIGGECDR